MSREIRGRHLDNEMKEKIYQTNKPKFSKFLCGFLKKHPEFRVDEVSGGSSKSVKMPVKSTLSAFSRSKNPQTDTPNTKNEVTMFIEDL